MRALGGYEQYVIILQRACFLLAVWRVGRDLAAVRRGAATRFPFFEAGEEDTATDLEKNHQIIKHIYLFNHTNTKGERVRKGNCTILPQY